MTRTDDLHALPGDLPVPVDDGACDHLRGAMLPAVRLRATSGAMVDLSREGRPWVVVYCYPRTGRPDQDPPGGMAAWNAIPGARGCTPQSCAYRDHHAELAALGAAVYGLSTQDSAYQSEAVDRLHFPGGKPQVAVAVAAEAAVFQEAGFVPWGADGEARVPRPTTPRLC